MLCLYMQGLCLFTELHSNMATIYALSGHVGAWPMVHVILVPSFSFYMIDCGCGMREPSGWEDNAL